MWRESCECVIKKVYLLGHLRALCPGCRHAPQSRARLTGGSSVVVVDVEVVSVTVAAVVVVVRRRVDERV